MAPPVLALILAILMAPLTTGINIESKDTIVENYTPSLALSDNLNRKMNAAEMLRQLLQRSNKGTCGVPTPKCETGCYGETNCVCYKSIPGSSSKEVYPCKEYSKTCRRGEHRWFDYTKIHPFHSASMPANLSCHMIRHGVTEEEKHQILGTHNNFRAKVARGEEYRSPQYGVSQPSGSNIKELIWNDELAYIAQKWAYQCKFDHEKPPSRRSACSRPYVSVGESLTIGPGTLNWPDSIKMWYDEVAITPMGIVSNFKSIDRMIGHYTQLVWAETYEIGCGAVHFRRGRYGGITTLHVCNYGPTGNTETHGVYKIGRPATECGKSGKSTKYPGLCATKI